MTNSEKSPGKEFDKPVSWGMLFKSALDKASSRLNDIQTGDLPQILPSKEEEGTVLNFDQFLLTLSHHDRMWLRRIFPESQHIISTFFSDPQKAEENRLYIATASIEQLSQVSLELPSLKQDLGLIVEYSQDPLYPKNIQAGATIRIARPSDPLLPTNSNDAIPQVYVSLIDMQTSSQNQILDQKASLESKLDSLQESVGESALILSNDLTNKLQIYNKLWKSLFRIYLTRSWFESENQPETMYSPAKGKPAYESHLILDIKQMLSADEPSPLLVQLVNPKQSWLYHHTLDLTSLAKGRLLPISASLDNKLTSIYDAIADRTHHSSRTIRRHS